MKNIEEYSELFEKDMEELVEIAEQKEVPDISDYTKEEFILAIEIADLALADE